MIEGLARLLVGHPGTILAIGLAHLALWGMLAASALRGDRASNLVWLPAALWLAYAAWEWIVLARTPEANIRVDLLVIWPAIVIATLFAAYRALRGWRARANAR